MADREDAEFRSGGARCAAWVFRPEGPGPHPAVVLAHGFGAVRDAGLEAYAARFAAEGILAFVFDYRHLGASEGRPRQLVSIGRQLADWRAAVAHVRGRADVDRARVALWGTSFSGGHVLEVASTDHEVAACVAQIPFVDGLAVTRAQGLRQATRLTVAGIADLLGAAVGRAPLTVPLVGPPGSRASMTTPDAEPGYLALVPDGAPWENAVAARSLLAVPLYRPGRRANAIRCPLLVCVARNDRITPAEPARRVGRRAARGSLREYPGGHFDLYQGAVREALIADQVVFLRTHLRPGGIGTGPAPSSSRK